MSKSVAIFLPTHCYFTSSRRLDGEEYKDYLLINTLYESVGQKLFIYYNRAFELAVAQGHDVLLLDTNMGSSATQAFLSAELERLNNQKMGISTRAVGFAAFIDVASMDCLEVMRSIYDMYDLEWNHDWKLWQSAYWGLCNLGTTVHGSRFALPRVT